MCGYVHGVQARPGMFPAQAMNVGKKAEGVFIARRSLVQQENNKNPRDWSCAKFTVAKMSATKGVKFQDTGDGTQNIVTNVEL